MNLCYNKGLEERLIVVFHDERLDRLSNAPGNIEEYYITDLAKVVLDGNHSIPQLQDVLKLVDNKVLTKKYS